MSRFFYFTAILIFVTSCTTSTQTVETNRKVVETNRTIAVNKTAAESVNQPAANTEIAVNADNIVVRDFSVSKKNARKWEEKRGNPKDNTPIADNIGELVTAAPDNSEVSSGMNVKGQPLETRVFKGHPQLAKIERLYVTMENPTLTVYLKNGKKIIVPNGKINNPLTDSADAILKAAGQN
ncbi:MAG: hypothetical protein LH614_09070 [Pyrinomonadaceae bacterium]|nr:hypothetical protein [Pyrinomonadaceae bacterium]